MKCERCGKKLAKYDVSVSRSGGNRNSDFEYDLGVCTPCAKSIVGAIDVDKIIIEVHGGVAYCDDPRVEIIDHDNREDEEDIERN